MAIPISKLTIKEIKVAESNQLQSRLIFKNF
jgi:hypothetical protein